MKNKTLCKILGFRHNHHIVECGGWQWEYVARVLARRLKSKLKFKASKKTWKQKQKDKK